MRFLFVHQNYPGQFPYLSAALVRQGHEVVAIGESQRLKQRGSPHPEVKRIGYEMPKAAETHPHPYLRDYENHIRRGQAVARVALKLAGEGYRPDTVIGHPGWGEVLFLKDVFPDARHIHYCEYFYRAEGGDVDFDPAVPVSIDQRLRTRIRNSTQLVGLSYADAGLSPTLWQASRYPERLRSLIKVIHDGIESEVARPDAGASFVVGQKALTCNDEIVTFVARNLEPYRGFHVFIKALPRVLAERPNAQVLVVGGDEISYGRPAPGGETWRSHCLAQLDPTVDLSRVHFLGKLPYAEYLKVLQISTVHVYLSYPFVLSWSMLEAMSVGCLVIGSATPPVQEVIEHENNGLLCDFFDSDRWSTMIVDALERRHEYQPLRQAARQTVLQRFDLNTRCLPEQLRFICDGGVGGR